ncbi:MAG: hypothetical protein WKF91_23810, partial [Segetibacter sp.]
NGKRFIAYELVKRLKNEGHSKILLQMKEGLTQHEIKKGQLHKVFEDRFDAKPVYVFGRFTFVQLPYTYLMPLQTPFA